MLINDPRATPSEEKINPVTELTWRLGEVKEGAQYLQRLKRMLEDVLQQQGLVVLKREKGQGQPLICTPSASARG